MGILDVKIKNSYTGKGQKILSDFLLPVLSETQRYDRVTGYYTIESLLAISNGLEPLFERKGKMRLIIGIHSFPADLVEASLKRKYLSEQIEIVREEVATKIATLTETLEQRRLATLAWMMEDDLLEVKAASVRGEGIFHPKTLIFTDEDGNKVAAVGSSNETRNGLGGNFEQLMVVKSWESEEAVEDQEAFFESIWNDWNPDVITSDITEVTAKMILNALGKKWSNPYHSCTEESKDIIADAAKMPANFFVSGDIPALFMHQERAVIDALSRWPVRVLFADEVGLGKTFEAAATLAFLVKYCGVKRTMILTPKSVLKQWQEELQEHFGLSTWLYDSGTKEYISEKGDRWPMYGKNPIGPSSPDMILMSAQYARGSGSNASIFERKDAILPDLLIVDEAHSARISESLTGGKKKTRMYKVLEEITNKIPHVILATATPMQKDAEEYHAILKLLGLPKIWNRERNYRLSLKLISRNERPDLSDASSAAALLHATLTNMRPKLSALNKQEERFVRKFEREYETQDKCAAGDFVIEHWDDFRKIFIRFHPARLLTVRNTRRALTDVGYVFPRRNLKEINVIDSENIQLFYANVNEYLTNLCFSVEKVLSPAKTVNVGFVRISYQQRVASSLFSCKESLKRRLEVVLRMRDYLQTHGYIKKVDLSGFGRLSEFDDFDDDDCVDQDLDLISGELKEKIDFAELSRAVSLECTSLTSLIKQAEMLLVSHGDMKIKTSVEKAVECLGQGDTVLLFSRYTDTIDGLLEEFKKYNKDNSITYGIYTGKKSVIITGGNEENCDKNQIKKKLFSKELKILFCSDAASEGLNLQAARVLINVDVPWTPSRLEQRIGRIARLGQVAEEVDIYNVWYPYSIEARMYHRIQQRLMQTNLAIGEFPEVVANSIKKSVLDGESDDSSMKELMDIRNSYQTQALEELWHKKEEHYTTSDSIRRQLIGICDKYLSRADGAKESELIEYTLPDGSKETVTAMSGMAETISLKSAVWKSINVTIPRVGVSLGNNGLPMAFTYNGPDCILKHEEVFRLLDERFEEEMVFQKRPKMLPDPDKLSLEYTMSGSIDASPEYWKEE